MDVFSHAYASVSASALLAFHGGSSPGNAVANIGALFGGIALGLLGLVFYEMRFMRKTLAIERNQVIEQSVMTPESKQRQLLEQQRVTVYKLSLMIAIGIGAHNFSEGLAIGQSYAAGSVELVLILIVGFGAHNATEGFGIAGPLTGLVTRPELKFLGLVGLIGGGRLS